MVKGYIAEVRSDEVVRLIDRADRVGTSWLGIPEVLSAISRLRRTGVLDEADAEAAKVRFLADDFRYHWLAIDRALAEQASTLGWRLGLRAVDSVHLATAQKWAAWMKPDDTLFATFDKQLARAARAEGLTVWPEEE